MAPVNANIAARLSELVARHPERPAIVETRGARTRRVSFAELDGRVESYAGAWRALGIGPGDRVLLFVPMSITLYAVLLATLRVGAVAVFVDAWADRARLDAAIARTRPRAFVGVLKAHLLRLSSRSVRSIPHAVIVSDRAPRAVADPAGPAVLGPDAPALVTFTTGSTGRPKAAERSHGFLWSQHVALAAHLELRDGEVDMPTLPVFVLNNLASGVTSVLPDFDPRRPGDIRADTVLAQMERERVTTSSGSPAFYERLAQACRASGRTLPLRALWTGGAPVLPPLVRALQALVPEAHVVYGSTEAEPIASIEAGEMLAAMEESPGLGLCVGAPVRSVECRLARVHDGSIALGPRGWEEWSPAAGEPGEVLVCGAHVLRGYLDDPAADRANKVRDGERVWHRTGDAARQDASGRLWLVGRVSQRVRRAAAVWWPGPVETFAVSVEGVRHAAYLGVPDAALGQRAVLCVECEHARLDPAAERRLRDESGAPVDEIRVLARIPRDPRHASKTDFEGLRRLLQHPG